MRRGTVQTPGGIGLVRAEGKGGIVRLAIIPEIGASVGVIHLTAEEAQELAYVLRAVSS